MVLIVPKAFAFVMRQVRSIHPVFLIVEVDNGIDP